MSHRILAFFATLAVALSMTALVYAQVGGYTVSLTVDGVQVGQLDLNAGTHDFTMEVTGPDGLVSSISHTLTLEEIPSSTTTSTSTSTSSTTSSSTSSTTTSSTTTTQPPTTTSTSTSTTLPPTTTTLPPTGNDWLFETDTLIDFDLALNPGDSIELRNNSRLMFTHPQTWLGAPTDTWDWDGISGSSITYNPDRDIRIFGDGDLMFMEGSGPSVIQYVEIDLRPAQEVGRYPLHFHMMGEDSRGTLVEGVIVKDSTNRAFVPHGSHGITIRDSVAVNTTGSAFWWDPPAFQSQDQTDNTNDTLWERNLAYHVTNAAGDNRGFRLSAFELGAGVGNVVRDSVAFHVDPSHRKDCSGFQWPEIHHNQPLTWGFENNASFQSDCNGIFVWQNNSQDHLIDGFIGDGIDHGAYTNDYIYRNVDVEFVEVHAVGWTMRDSHAGTIYSKRHQFSGSVYFINVDADRVVIQDGGGGSASLFFTDTNLTCSDVEVQSKAGGSQVFINGSSCDI